MISKTLSLESIISNHIISKILIITYSFKEPLSENCKAMITTVFQEKPHYEFLQAENDNIYLDFYRGAVSWLCFKKDRIFILEINTFQFYPLET